MEPTREAMGRTSYGKCRRAVLQGHTMYAKSSLFDSCLYTAMNFLNPTFPLLRSVYATQPCIVPCKAWTIMCVLNSYVIPSIGQQSVLNTSEIVFSIGAVTFPSRHCCIRSNVLSSLFVCTTIFDCPIWRAAWRYPKVIVLLRAVHEFPVSQV